MSLHRRCPGSLPITLTLAGLLLAGCGSDKTNAPEQPSPVDEIAPLAPVGFAVAFEGTTKFSLTWEANAEPDLAGYKVYRYDPDPEEGQAYVSVTGDRLLNQTRWISTGEPGRLDHFRVTAIDATGNESGWSETLTFAFNGDEAEEPAEEIGSDDEHIEVEEPGGSSHPHWPYEETPIK